MANDEITVLGFDVTIGHAPRCDLNSPDTTGVLLTIAYESDIAQ